MSKTSERRLKNKQAIPLLPGTRFERLTVQSLYSEHRQIYLCVCDCGKTVKAESYDLRRGKVKSCGCYKNEMIGKRSTTHGLSNLPFFDRWIAQLRRDADSVWTHEMDVFLFQFQPACVICGSTKKLSVDHVKPFSKGYGLSPGNAVILCGFHNSSKGRRDLSELPQDWQEKIARAAKEFETAWNER